MPGQASSRPAETLAAEAFLGMVERKSSALVVEGEAGIGKSTLWSATVEQARRRGFTVLAARPNAAESVLAYAVLADLLAGVDPAVVAELPAPQRIAMDRVLLRTDSDGPATDLRAVGAAFLSIVLGLAERAPVLMAVDDLQWVDASSWRAISYAARRLTGRIGVLATVRTDAGSPGAATDVQLGNPADVTRIRLAPLSVGGLHVVIENRLGFSLPRPVLVRIHQSSGGNPFYALELARAMDEAPPGREPALPGSLAELVNARVGSLEEDVLDVLLAAACIGSPTLDLVALATDRDEETTTELLERAERKGILDIEGTRLRFTHPLLAHGVASGATAVRRRRMHRRLADLVTEPELAARHLALSSTTVDDRILTSLDEAAEMARRRGAPAAAAELLELAAGLGGDTAERRIRTAADHFKAGDSRRARLLLERTTGALGAGVERAQAVYLLAVVRLFDDSFVEAAQLLQRSLDDAAGAPALRARMQIALAFALVNSGDLVGATQVAGEAVSDTSTLTEPHLHSQALGMRATLQFMLGDGFDAMSVLRAVELEDPMADFSAAFSPSVQSALLRAWTGGLDDAQRDMLEIRRRCMDGGAESDLVFVSFHGGLIDVWLGEFARAGLLADDAVERAAQMGGDLPLSVALTMRASVAAYTGDSEMARRDALDALAASQRCGSLRLGEWPVNTLGFLDVSLGDYQAALTTLAPMLARFAMAPDAIEIIAGSFLPDAVEAMVQLNRLAEAEPLVAALERNGRRLDRPWMLATGARCRAMVLAAGGDADAAIRAAEEAMTHHDRLPMPFERARTLLVVGQVQRRRRRKEAAATALRAAQGAFEDLGSPLWAHRARVELDRTNTGAHRATTLTPSEQRVAQLAASGMTNRDVAAALFISPKTVESNLARVYRKLGIRSRAELGRHVGAIGG